MLGEVVTAVEYITIKWASHDLRVVSVSSSLFCCQCSLQEEAVVGGGQLVSVEGKW